MKNKRISLFSMMLSLMIALFVGASVQAATALPALPVSAVLFTASFIPVMPGVTLMAISKEIWLNDIEANIYKANPFMNFAMNADAFVLEGRVVHIPNAGSKPAVSRNRSKYPATVTIRQDSDITFVLDEFTSDPIKIENAAKYELSYDKRASVMGEQSAAIDEAVGDWMLKNWAPTTLAKMVRTSGDAIAGHYGTGDRKKVTLADIKSIQKAFTKAGIPSQNRYALLDADMYDQMTDEMTLTQSREFSKALNEQEGVVGKLFGFTFLDARATVLRYTNASTPVVKDPDAADADTDNGAGLFWHKDTVLKAVGTKDFFEDENNPEYYGDIYSALVRAGGRKKRADGNGVIALVQAAA